LTFGEFYLDRALDPPHYHLWNPIVAEAADVQAQSFARVAAPQYGFAWLIAGSFALTYLLLITQTASLPMQDMPNHLARAVVMADLMFHQGARFGEIFQYQFMPIPYVLPDVMFAALVELFGPNAAGALWNALSWICVPAALMFYMRVLKAPQDTRAFVLLLSLFLATDWFFLMGFVGFRFAIALGIVGLGLAQMLREQWSWRVYAALCAVAAVGYFTHLSTILFLGVAIGVTGFVRWMYGRSSLKTELLLLAPLAAMIAWHVLIASGYNSPADKSINKYRWGSAAGKIRGLYEHWTRFSMRTDLVLMALAALALVWPLRQRLTRRALTQVSVIEMLAIFFVLAAIYWVLPFSYSEATYVEDRPLGLMLPALIIGALSLPAAPGERRPLYSTGPIMLMSLVLVLNLVALGKHLLKDEAWLKGYREVVAAIPTGATVLPINTKPKDGRMSPWLHAGSYVVADRAGIVPILFAADRGDAMKYFRYRDKPFAPKESWYLDSNENVIDWESVACDYEYVLVSKPFEVERVPFSALVVTENDSAALLAVNRSSCPAALQLRPARH
jgi:hypothetical protein